MSQQVQWRYTFGSESDFLDALYAWMVIHLDLVHVNKAYMLGSKSDTYRSTLEKEFRGVTTPANKLMVCLVWMERMGYPTLTFGEYVGAPVVKRLPHHAGDCAVGPWEVTYVAQGRVGPFIYPLVADLYKGLVPSVVTPDYPRGVPPPAPDVLADNQMTAILQAARGQPKRPVLTVIPGMAQAGPVTGFDGDTAAEVFEIRR